MSSWYKRPEQRSRQRKAARAAGLVKAPGDLEILQDFVNTIAHDRQPDRLKSPEDLAAWLARRDLLATDVQLDEAQWRQALDLRRDLRALILADKGEGVDSELLRGLERVSANGRLVVRFDDRGPSSFGPASDRFDDALAALIALVALARFEDSWSRLVLCSRKDCRRAFFTDMRQTAKWCTPQCGERVRAARRRARRPS